MEKRERYSKREIGLEKLGRKEQIERCGTKGKGTEEKEWGKERRID